MRRAWSMSAARAPATCSWSTPADSARCRTSSPTSGPSILVGLRPHWPIQPLRHMSESSGLTEPFTTEVDLPAPVEEVFRHLTDPAAMVRWMGQHASLQPVPGGAFEIDINGVPVRGHYLEVDPPRRVLVRRGLTGNPGPPPGPTQGQFPLPPTAAGTRLRLVHRSLPPQQASIHATGWQHFLDRLTRAAFGVDPGPDPWDQGS